MKLGVSAWVTDRGVGICDVARQVEAAGLESLFLVQNTHVPVSGASLLEDEQHKAAHHFLDPFVALGAAAAVTNRIKLGTGICVALTCDPIILAMQVATLDQLSSGRFLSASASVTTTPSRTTASAHGGVRSPAGRSARDSRPIRDRRAVAGTLRWAGSRSVRRRLQASDDDSLRAFLDRYTRLIDRFAD